MDQTMETNQLKKEDLQKINQYTRRNFTEKELFSFTVVLCDNEVDRDGEAFTTQSLQELKSLYLGTTGIFDHSQKSEDQAARIFHTWVETDPQRKTQYGEPYSCLKAKAYMVRTEKDKDLLLEIDAGIKKEVSVGCRVLRKTCSICGADLSYGCCEHKNGEFYQGKLCYTKLEQPVDAYEWSFVAVPAQPAAGVTKQYHQTEIQPKRKVRTNEEVVKSLGTGNISVEEQKNLKLYIDRLEEKALLGQEYLQDLKSDIISLSFLSNSPLDEQAICILLEKMDAKELKQLKKAFTKSCQKTGKPQLGYQEPKKDTSENHEFYI